MIQLNLFYMIYISYAPLYDGAFARKVELMNESIHVIICYHLMVFANYREWS